MPQQLAARGVGERTVVSKFVDLPDMVKERAGEQQVAINVRVIAAHQVARIEQRDYVLQQTSDESVMQGLGGRSVAVGFRNLRVGHERLNQRLEGRGLESCDVARQCLLLSWEDSQRNRLPILPGGAFCGW